MKKLTPWLLFLLLVISLIPAFSPSIKASPFNWYVSPTGSDSSGDGSYGNPYGSIQKAMNRSSNGDIINMRKGDYTNIWENVPGAIQDGNYDVQEYPLHNHLLYKHILLISPIKQSLMEKGALSLMRMV